MGVLHAAARYRIVQSEEPPLERLNTSVASTW
jgi:hypothetical protein